MFGQVIKESVGLLIKKREKFSTICMKTLVMRFCENLSQIGFKLWIGAFLNQLL